MGESVSGAAQAPSRIRVLPDGRSPSSEQIQSPDVRRTLRVIPHIRFPNIRPVAVRTHNKPEPMAAPSGDPSSACQRLSR
jgi:hypothetical protein